MTVFWRWWGAAAVFHVIGNRRWGEVWPDPTILGVLTLGLLAAGLWAMVRPGPRPGSVLAGFFILTAVAETPVLSNHMLVAAFVSTWILVARPWQDEERVVPGARAVLVAFYAFAAFAKINSAFLDPTVSCAVFYADQGLTILGLPSIQDTVWAAPLPWLTVAVEASVPILLLVPSTRRAGVVLATAFHILISFDLGQHFYDFTAVLVPLFFLFLPWHRRVAIGHCADDLLRGPLRLVAPLWVVIVGLLGLLTVLPFSATTGILVQYLPFAAWIPLALGYLAVLVGTRVAGGSTERAIPAAAWVLVAFVVLNGVLPYLEVKRVADFTMYANLHIAEGETNHLVVRRSVPIGDGNADPYTVVASDDPSYEPYVDSGWALPERNVAATPPDASTVLERSGVIAEAPEPLDGAAVWFNRVFPLRAVDATSPTRCQTGFLPAR